MKFRAFTIIEMLVTLTLFAMTLVVIMNLLGASLNFMQSIGGSDRSKSSGILLVKVLDKTLRDSYRITDTNGFYMIDAFDDRRYAAKILSNSVVLSEYRNRNWEIVGEFVMESADKISLEIVRRGGRQAVRFFAGFPNGDIERTMILGYRKDIEVVHE